MSYIVLTEQEKILLGEITLAGLICGLNHPIEWFRNYSRFLPSTMKYSEVSYMQLKVNTLMCKVLALKNHQDQPYTMDEVNEIVDSFYGM